MKCRELYLKMLNAKEQHDSIKFADAYIRICTALNIDASSESVGILDDEMHDSNKQVIMSKILIDIQNLLKK